MELIPGASREPAQAAIQQLRSGPISRIDVEAAQVREYANIRLGPPYPIPAQVSLSEPLQIHLLPWPPH